MTRPDLHSFHEAINRLSALTPEALADVDALASSREVDGGAHLLRAGEHATRIVFLRRGVMREYYTDSNGQEFTRRFCQANEFSGSLGDLLGTQPAAVSIETLVPCEITEIQWRAIDALAERHPSVMKLLRRSAEVLYLRKMQREFEMLTLSAADRYRRFVEEFPELDVRLTRNMVATYLGITSVHLSRVRAAERRTQSTTKRVRRT